MVALATVVVATVVATVRSCFMDTQIKMPDPLPTTNGGDFFGRFNIRNIILGVLLLVLVSISGYTFYRIGVAPSQTSTEEMSPYAQLEMDVTYARAEELLQEGDLDAARTLYLEVLKNVEGPEQEGQILYKIALTETRTDSESAVARLKSIATSDTYSNILRAYAVQRLGLMFYYVDDRDRVVPLIFESEPYASFYQEEDILLSLRRVFDYASTFYPLAIAELRSAAWYANEIRYVDVAERAVLVEQYLPIIEEKLTNADRDVERTINLNNPRTLIPEALYLKAVVIARLDIAGLAFDGEQAFRETLEYVSVDGTPEDEAFTRYGYATYLLASTPTPEDEVKDLLQSVIENPDAYPALMRMLVNERGDALGQKKGLVQVANFWEEFKILLISLGWSEDEFIIEGEV